MTQTRVPKATGLVSAGTSKDLEPVKPAGALSAFNAATAFAGDAPQSGSYLPALKIPYAIEMGSNGIEAAHIFVPGLYDGKKFTPFASSYTLVALASRNCARRLVAGADGKKTYTRAYAALQDYKKSAETYESMAREAANDRGTELGVAYLLAVLTADDKGQPVGSIAQVDCFGVMTDYWGKPLFQARLPNRQGVDCMACNHSVNLVEGKADPTRKYLSPKKHVQWKIVDLTPENLALVSAAWDDNKKGVDGWLNK